VTILFDNKLFRGNRTTKKDSEGFDAFGTPNMLPLAVLEISIHGEKSVQLISYKTADYHV
jgi:L-asparaginase